MARVQSCVKEISTKGKTGVRIIKNGILTVSRYDNKILDVLVPPYTCAVGPDFILMDDYAGAHGTRITNQYHERATIVELDWQRDINPIEHA